MFLCNTLGPSERQITIYGAESKRMVRNQKHTCIGPQDRTSNFVALLIRVQYRWRSLNDLSLPSTNRQSARLDLGLSRGALSQDSSFHADRRGGRIAPNSRRDSCADDHGSKEPVWADFQSRRATSTCHECRIVSIDSFPVPLPTPYCGQSSIRTAYHA